MRGARARARPGCTLAIGFLVLLLAGSGCAGSSRPAPGQANAPAPSSPPGRAPRVTVPAGFRPAGREIAHDFLGLSFEAADLPRLGAYSTRGDLVRLLRSLGPGVLRVGGATVDTQAVWSPGATALAPWAHTRITAADLSAIGALARATGWRVLLAVNLGHYDPRGAAEEVQAARAALGHALIAVELGNEPDAFVRESLRSTGWGFARYAVEVSAYRRAIEALAPGVALAGPDAVNVSSGLSWVKDEAARERPALLTGHYYPLGRCQQYVPQTSDLLDPGLRVGESKALALLAGIGRSSAIPLRVDETNNVACGGQPGVSDTFASALWALDYTVRAMDAGVAGINFHGNPAHPSSYAPLAADSAQALEAGSLTAKPEWYALLVARRLLGDRPLRAANLAPAGLVGSTTAFLRPDGGLHILVVNDAPPGAVPLVVHVPRPQSFDHATVLRLTAPAPSALSGVRLGGRSVAPDGGFVAGPLPRIPAQASSLSVTVAPSSAALVTVSLHRGAPGR